MRFLCQQRANHIAYRLVIIIIIISIIFVVVGYSISLNSETK